MSVDFVPKMKKSGVQDEGFWAGLKEDVWMSIFNHETSCRFFAKKVCEDFIIVTHRDILVMEYKYMPYSYSFLNYLSQGTLTFSANIGPNGEAKDA